MILSKKRDAFTIIEILIGISLLAIILSMTMFSLDPMLASLKERSPVSILKASVKRAYEEANNLGKEVALRFDFDKNSLVLTEYESAKIICEFEFGEKSKSIIEIDFIPVYPNSISENSKMSFNTAKSLNALRYSPDGSSTPAQIIIRDGLREDSFLTDSFSPVLLKDDS